MLAKTKALEYLTKCMDLGSTLQTQWKAQWKPELYYLCCPSFCPWCWHHELQHFSTRDSCCITIFLILVGLQRCGKSLVLPFKQNKPKQNKILKLPIIPLSLLLDSIFLSSKENTFVVISVNSNFICMQTSHPVLQLVQKMLIICSEFL